MGELAPVTGLYDAEDIAKLTRSWLEPSYGEEAWKSICDELSIKYRQRSVTKALVSSCVFHREQTPSFWMYPSGVFCCYGGCQRNGDIADFIFAPDKLDGNVPPCRLLQFFGQAPDELRHIDPVVDRLLTPMPGVGQLVFQGLEIDAEI